ncbi:hypothetical protein BGX28_000443 [Mortierella sp. GBA30]|nr:hypothetical protein BGX28_000443 [Mortierella sp. GBA30]
MIPTTSSPLDIPEIRVRISLYLTTKAALACVQVSKVWAQDFVHPLWHTVDFKIHKRFIQLSPEIIDKHGHHIRVVRNMLSHLQLKALQRPNIRHLSYLSAAVGDMEFQYGAECFDFIYNNSASLRDVTIRMTDGNKPSRPFFIHAYAFIPNGAPAFSSKLSRLQLNGFSITRRSLSMLLQNCPALETLGLWNVCVSPAPTVDKFQHQGLLHLGCLARDIGLVSISHSILQHFPNLGHLQLLGRNQLSDVALRNIQGAVERWCHGMSSLSTDRSTGPVVEALLVNVFRSLVDIRIDYASISPSVILAVLNHRASLVHFAVYVPKNDFYEHEAIPVPAINDHFQSSAWMIQSIPRQCPRLSTFELPLHDMDIDNVESGTWICEELEDLRVRIKGLDTLDAIDRTISLWMVFARTKQAATADPDNAALKSDHAKALDKIFIHGSIEGRVAAHLIQFPKLKTVWLGTKVWNL